MSKTGKFAKRVSAAAASLGAVGATTAHADIIHFTTPISRSVSDGGSVDWDLDGIGAAEYQLRVLYDGAYVGVFLEHQIAGQQLVRDTAGRYNHFDRLNSGFEIGTSMPANFRFDSQAGRPRRLIRPRDTDPRGFTDGQAGLFGFSFRPNGTDVFGWASLTLDPTARVATINEWAYENSGASILAGATATTAAVPEPSSLALLSLGAVGVATMRRRRKREQDAEADNAS